MRKSIIITHSKCAKTEWKTCLSCGLQDLQPSSTSPVPNCTLVPGRSRVKGWADDGLGDKFLVCVMTGRGLRE